MKSPPRSVKVAVAVSLLGAVLLLWLWRVEARSDGEASMEVVQVPDGLADAAMFEQRAEIQLASTDQFDVNHAFSFSDEREASGIDFRHRIVDDVGVDFKKVHYDHGNSLSVADVDGDGLYDIYFTNQIGPNELWRNLGDGRFENITRESGVGLDKPVSVASSFADIDNDGDQDLFVTTVRFGNVLFENDGAGRFTDISEQAGLDYVGHSSGAVFFDYDRDGLLDLFLTNVGTYTTDELVPMHVDDREDPYYFYAGIGNDQAFKGHLVPERYERNILYRNMGGNRFVEVSEQVGLVDSSWSGDATVIDGNDDGWPDLYILSMQGNDVYYENVDGKRFAEKTASLFPKTPWGAMGAKVLDFNNDGRMDLYVTDMHCDMWEADEIIYAGREKLKPRPNSVPSDDHLGTSGTSIFGNALFRNDGGGSFTDVTAMTGTETYWPWGISSGDLNADGYEDLFVASSMNYPYRYAVNKVLLNNRGERFLDSEYVVGVEPREDERMTQVWFEVDCAESWHEHCSTANPTARVEVRGAVGTRSSVVFDLDNDGDLDIVTNEFNGSPMVLVSDLNERSGELSSLRMELVGTTSNRDGLGARVEVHTGSKTITKVYDGNSGYLAQSSYPLFFGLGDEEIERIEITWPSGVHQVLDAPTDLSTPLEVVEPS